jgi:transcriptional regulator with XRE-family HTH domain
MTDTEIENVLDALRKSPLTGYFIAQKTGITEQTILNYRSKKTIPTQANAKLLEYFFNDESANRSKKNSVGNNIVASGRNNINAPINIDERKYYSDSPDVLRSQVEEKDKLLREKDERLREKDDYIKELKAIIQESKKNNADAG